MLSHCILTLRLTNNEKRLLDTPRFAGIDSSIDGSLMVHHYTKGLCMTSRFFIYAIICSSVMGPSLMHAEETKALSINVSNEYFQQRAPSFIQGMTLAPFIQIPWILGWGLGQAHAEPPLSTMRSIFLEFVEGTQDRDVYYGLSGLFVQQIVLTKLAQVFGTYRHNSFLQNPIAAWLVINCMLTIFKLFRVKNNLTELNRMIAGIKRLHLKDLIAFHAAKTKGLHNFFFK
jgi:hypothetical protein